MQGGVLFMAEAQIRWPAAAAAVMGKRSDLAQQNRPVSGVEVGKRLRLSTAITPLRGDTTG